MNMTPSMQAWESMLNRTSIARFFSGIFNVMGIRVQDTNESFTVHHKEDHFELSPGIAGKVDYLVDLQSENISNMQSHGADGVIDANESFRIMSVLFTPLTSASLDQPMLKNPFLRMFSGIENHIIVYLEHPTKDESVAHTILYLNKEWLVVPGAHGNAKRIFRINPSQAIDYQRKIFRAIQEDSSAGWKAFKKWYLNWRKDVSVVG